MTVPIDKLLRMGEQISANMAYTDDSDIVVARIADHLSRFWDPRMLAAIKEHYAQHPETLSPELSGAVAALG
jgi:formate dehydrogenase subunit delta